jgi:hypothetical protein
MGLPLFPAPRLNALSFRIANLAAFLKDLLHEVVASESSARSTPILGALRAGLIGEQGADLFLQRPHSFFKRCSRHYCPPAIWNTASRSLWQHQAERAREADDPDDGKIGEAKATRNLGLGAPWRANDRRQPPSAATARISKIRARLSPFVAWTWTRSAAAFTGLNSCRRKRWWLSATFASSTQSLAPGAQYDRV